MKLHSLPLAGHPVLRRCRYFGRAPFLGREVLGFGNVVSSERQASGELINDLWRFGWRTEPVQWTGF